MPKDEGICDLCGGYRVHEDEFERCVCLPEAPECPSDASVAFGTGYASGGVEGQQAETETGGMAESEE